MAFAFECFGEYNKPTRSHVMRDPTFLMDSIFDRETRERKERQKFFDELIYRNGHVTFEDWMKWCTHNRRSVRPLVQSCELQHWSRVESAADFVIRGWREFFQHMNFFHTGFDDFADEYVDRWTDRRAASAFAQILRDEQALIDRGGGRVMDDDRLRWQRELDEE